MTNDVAKKDEVPVDAFKYFDDQDSEAIKLRYEGAEFGYMVYKYPIGDTNICGVGINGILELRQHWGGIETRVVSIQKATRNNKPGWEAEVEAADLFTGNKTSVKYFELISKPKKTGGYYDNPYAYITAQSKAKRNAIRELLPQAPLKLLAELALAGQTEFGEKDVINIFGRHYQDRQNLKRQMFAARIQGQVALATAERGYLGPAKAIDGELVEGKALPTGDETPPQEAETAPSGDDKGEGRSIPSPKQKGFLKGLLKKRGLNSEQMKQFYDEIIDGCGEEPDPFGRMKDVLNLLKDDGKDDYLDKVIEKLKGTGGE
jgi:hypothetical protein